jgi:hypothetical protein
LRGAVEQSRLQTGESRDIGEALVPGNFGVAADRPGR